MSKPSNPALIGTFVVGAVALLVVAVLLFGGTQFFADKQMLVSYFPDSVKGLRAGSSVVLRGVPVGFVRDIQLQGQILETGSLETLVEVTMEVKPGTFELFSNGNRLSAERRSRLSTQEFVEAGVRAKLSVDSFVTGQLMVEFDFQPDIEAVYRGRRSPYPEVPTIPSDVQRVLERLQTFLTNISAEIDFTQLSKNIQGIAAGLDEIANSPDLRGVLAGGNRLANEAFPRLVSALEVSLGDIRSATQDARRLLGHVDAQIDPLMADLLPAVRRLDETLGNAEALLGSMSRQVREDSELSLQIGATLQELQGVSRSARILLDYLGTHPEALLRGKQAQH